MLQEWWDEVFYKQVKTDSVILLDAFGGFNKATVHATASSESGETTSEDESETDESATDTADSESGKFALINICLFLVIIFFQLSHVHFAQGDRSKSESIVFHQASRGMSSRWTDTVFDRSKILSAKSPIELCCKNTIFNWQFETILFGCGR